MFIILNAIVCYCSDLQQQVAFSKSNQVGGRSLPLRVNRSHSHRQASPTSVPRSSRSNQQIVHTLCFFFFLFFPTAHRKCRPLPLRDGGWLVIREGQIASLGLPAICRPGRLIPPRGPGLPGSGLPSPSVSLHAVSPTSLQKPSLQCPTASHQC